MKDLLDVTSGEKTLFIFETTNQKNKPKKPTHITLDDNEDDRTTIVRSMVKVVRAQGGCLGTKSR